MHMWVGVLPWFFNESSKGRRPYLSTSDFARGGDMMIGSKGTGGTRLYCRWCDVGWCYEHADRRGGDWYLTLGNEALAAAEGHSFAARTATYFN